MAGCSVILIMPILAGFGIVMGAFMILQLAFEALVGTIALPLLVVSTVCGIAACVVAARALWLRFHDHQDLSVSQMVVLPAILAAIAFVTFAIALGVSGVAFFESIRVIMEAPPTEA